MKTRIAVGAGEKRLIFWCPGCDGPHTPRIEGAHAWTWNGDRERPTLTPSILVRDGVFVCHSYLTDGQIKFLDDCTHDLANKTVPLPDFPEYFGTQGAE